MKIIEIVVIGRYRIQYRCLYRHVDRNELCVLALNEDVTQIMTIFRNIHALLPQHETNLQGFIDQHRYE
jgi:hypothetical protein